MSTNSNDGNNQTDDKKRVSTPTIGDAVKEAIETGKEVIMQGPTDTEDFDDLKDIISNATQLTESDKEMDKGIALSVDQTDTSKLEISVNDASEDLLIDDKIIVSPDKEEAKVETVTTIPADEGIDIEVKTEVEVPIENKNKDVESDQKVLVHSPDLTTEVSIDSSSMPSSSPSYSSLEKERNISTFDKEKDQQSTDKGSIETKDNLNKKFDNIPITFSSTIFENFDKANIQITQTAKDMMNKYVEFQTQAINSFQSAFYTLLENSSNIFWNSHLYCTNMQETYSKMAMAYTENTITLGKMINGVVASNADYLKNFLELSKNSYNNK
jgi:hypothetical protein